MFMRPIAWCPVIWIAATVLPATASGSILTFAFDGQVDVVDDRHGLLPFVHVGDRVTYTFSFDSDAPDTNPYIFAAEYKGLTAFLKAGSMDMECPPPTIIIQHPGDVFDVESDINVSLPRLQPGGSIYFALIDQAESNALPNTALPTVPYDLTPFASREFSASFILPPPAYSEAASFWGHIDRFYAVPEPATLALVLAGGLLVLARGRTQNSRS